MLERKYLTAVLIVVLGAILLYNSKSGLIARQSETCAAVNDVKQSLTLYIEQQLNRSAKSLPTIDYYKNHPVELGRALANLAEQREQTRRAFAPTDC